MVKSLTASEDMIAVVQESVACNVTQHQVGHCHEVLSMVKLFIAYGIVKYRSINIYRVLIQDT